MPASTYPLFRVGQEIYVQRDQRLFRKGEKVKVRRYTAMISSFRYEVEREYTREWCMESDLALHPPTR